MKHRNSFSIRSMILSSLLIGAQIVLARFAGIQINEGLRISFETIPLILGSFWLGPLWGIFIAVLSDILGTLISGYGIYFPLLTVGPLLLTLIIGLAGSHFPDKERSDHRFYIRYVLIVLAAETINMLYVTWALTIYYSIVVGKEMPFRLLFLARIATKPVTICIDTLLSCLLHRSLFTPVVSKYLGATNAKQKKEI